MNELSAQQKKDYLNNKILPCYLPMIEQDMYMTVYDIDCSVGLTTDKTARSIGWQYGHECVGESYNKPSKNFVDHAFSRHGLDTLHVLAIGKKIYNLQLLAMEQKKTLSFIDLLPYDNKFEGYITTLIPIFHPNGEVIGLISTSVYYPLFGLNEFLLLQANKHVPRRLIIPNREVSVKLSSRQHEVLFLLTNGFSQSHIATMLGIKRGTVAKMVFESICPKFNVSDKAFLIKKALKMGYDTLMPKSLWKHYLLLVDEGGIQLID